MMKHLILMLLLVVSLAWASTNAAAQTKPGKTGDEQALIALDKQWTAAELRLNDDDRKAINGIVAADYTGTTPFGQIENKVQYIADLKHSDDTNVADEYALHFSDGGKCTAMTLL